MSLSSVAYARNALPEECPACHHRGPKGSMGRSPATPNEGHWFEHKLTGFRGVACGNCNHLIPFKDEK